MKTGPRLRDAEVTVIGGGAVGCATAYTLAAAGYRDVQVIERGELCGATSAQAAGLVGQVRPTAERCLLAMASVGVYSRLQDQTGYPADWRQTGSVRIALTAERAAEFRRLADVAARCGLDVEILSPARLAQLCPTVSAPGVTAALWCPTDGYLQPYSLVTAYASAARDLGVSFATGTTVTGLRLAAAGRDAGSRVGGEVTGIRTDQGDAATGMVIIAAGPWSAAVAGLAGIQLPIVPVRHEYFVTMPVDDWHPGLPVLRVPDIRLYARAEGQAILCGGWEPNAMSLDPRDVGIGQPLHVQPDWDVLAGFARDFAQLVPPVTQAGVRWVFRGFPAFSPDGRFVVGPVPGIRGLVMAAACNAHGVSGSAGLAMHLLESMQPDPSPYVRSLSPARFLPPGWDWDSARAQATRVYQDYYSIYDAPPG